MLDLIMDYHNSIAPLLGRIAELDSQIAVEPDATRRTALCARRTGLQVMVSGMQRSIQDMLDREAVQQPPNT